MSIMIRKSTPLEMYNANKEQVTEVLTKVLTLYFEEGTGVHHFYPTSFLHDIITMIKENGFINKLSKEELHLMIEMTKDYSPISSFTREMRDRLVVDMYPIIIELMDKYNRTCLKDLYEIKLEQYTKMLEDY